MPAAAFAVVIALVLFRSAIFLLKPHLFFDADQGVFGLMAKHLVEGRALPIFMYGQHYILAVEAWMAAPVFFVAGVSVASLKFPLLLVNLAIGLLLIVLLQRDGRLTAGLALAASLFFVLAPPGTTGTLLAASGGNVEPFLYILLLWVTRRRPAWFGVILGIGFLQREFTAYGAAALAVIEFMGGAWRQRRDWSDTFRALRVTAEVWLVVQVLVRFSSTAGPGTESIVTARTNNFAETLGRFCFDPRTFVQGLSSLVTEHWARLFGAAYLPVMAFGLESGVKQGLRWSGVLLAAIAVLCAARIAVHVQLRTAWWRQHAFCAYLVLVGAMSAGMLGLGRCGQVSLMRYDLLSILGAVGLAAWAFSVETRTWIRHLEVAAIVCWALVSLAGHTRLWAEQLDEPRPSDKALILRELEARNIHYALSDYWIAYYMTFLTREEIVVAAHDNPRIALYNNVVAAHRSEAILISRTPCGRPPIISGVYFCPAP